MGYIEEVIKSEYQKRIVIGATCDFCSENIQMIDNYILEGALHIVLGGGYGMYYDGDGINLIVCKDCVRKLIEVFPVISDLMDKSYGI